MKRETEVQVEKSKVIRSLTEAETAQVTGGGFIVSE